MLQHTGRFCSRISQERTTWQHRSIPHTLLTWLQLIFACSHDWNQHWRDGALAMLLITVRMWWKSWNGFQECFQRLYFRWQKCMVIRGTVLKEMLFKWWYHFVFLRNDVILRPFWSYTYILVIQHPDDDDGHGSDRNMFVKNNMCWNIFINVHFFIYYICIYGFKPGRSRRIFRAKKSSARLPSEGK